MRLPGGVVMQPPGSPDSGRSSRRTGFQRVDGRSRVGMTTLTWASGQAAGHRCTEGRAPHLTAPVRGREHGPDGGQGEPTNRRLRLRAPSVVGRWSA